MEKTYKNCQSCGIPINRDPGKGGTNEDGSKNLKFCSFCYTGGKFTFDGDVKQFQEHCRLKMIEGGHSRFTAYIFSRGLSRLERWKN